MRKIHFWQPKVVVGVKKRSHLTLVWMNTYLQTLTLGLLGDRVSCWTGPVLVVFSSLSQWLLGYSRNETVDTQSASLISTKHITYITAELRLTAWLKDRTVDVDSMKESSSSSEHWSKVSCTLLTVTSLVNQQHNPLILPCRLFLTVYTDGENESVCVYVCVLHHQQFLKNNYLTPTASAAGAELLLHTSSEEERCQLLTGNTGRVWATLC